MRFEGTNHLEPRGRVFRPRPRDPFPGKGFGVNQIREAVRRQQAFLPALSLSGLGGRRPAHSGASEDFGRSE